MTDDRKQRRQWAEGLRERPFVDIQPGDVHLLIDDVCALDDENVALRERYERMLEACESATATGYRLMAERDEALAQCEALRAGGDVLTERAQGLLDGGASDV
jgi:hypothetical protein